MTRLDSLRKINQTIRLFSSANDRVAHTRYAQPPRNCANVMVTLQCNTQVRDLSTAYIIWLTFSLCEIKMTGPQAPREEFDSQTCAERAVRNHTGNSS